MTNPSLLPVLTAVLLALASQKVDLASNSAPGEIVISQVYGAGGNSGAVFRNDFVELFNRSSNPLNLAGWALQYTSATGASWSKVDLSGTIAPGSYVLVQLASGGANGAPLPTPDVTGTIAMAATAGKVALTNSSTLLSGSCPASATLVDLVGYGVTASCFEGSGAAPAPSSTASINRAMNGCKDTDQNAADFAAAPASPRNSSSPASICNSGGARFASEDVKVVLSAADPCAEMTVSVSLTNSGSRTQRDNAGAEFVAQLPAGLKPVPGQCQSSSGVCSEVDDSRLEWNGSVAPGAMLSLSWRMKIDFESAKPGDELCIGLTVNYDANDDGSNEGRSTASTCLTVTCQPGSPGIAFPVTSEQGHDRPGSVLVFPFYSSASASPALENTTLSLTNVSLTRPVTVHLFFMVEDSPLAADMFMCLSTNQTRSFLASEVDPNSAGYLIALAVDSMTGCPISFNHLLGEGSVKLMSGHFGTLPAEALAALSNDGVTCTASSSTAELRFDGIAFSKAPRTLALDNIPSQQEGFSTLLVLNRFGGNLVTGASTLGQIGGLLFNDAETGFSFSLSTNRRQLRSRLSDAFPRTAPRFSAIIPAGQTGWGKVWVATDGAIFGSVFVANWQAQVSASVFAGARSLHKLTLTDAVRLTIPVFPPTC